MQNYKEKIKDIKNRSDILDYIIPKKITKKEENEALRWWINHKCFLDESNWERDLDLDCLYPNVELTPTPIGSLIWVVCPFCNESKNVTDFDQL